MKVCCVFSLKLPHRGNSNENTQFTIVNIKKKITLNYPKSAATVQLGYCDSDVTVCLLFWNMPIIQDRDVKYPYKQYIYYLQAF